MSLSVLLLRGINVGGANKLRMADLRTAIEVAGGKQPQTYIQSGNAIFDSEASRDRLTDAIEERAGIRPDLLAMPAKTFLSILAANPFPTDDHKALHLFFLPHASSANPVDLEAAGGREERFLLTDQALFLYAPNYLSGSRLAPALDRLLGVRATGRNWRTCRALRDMIKRRS